MSHLHDLHFSALACCMRLMCVYVCARGGADLQYTHAISVAKDLVRLSIVAVADSGCSNEEFKWIILFQVKSTTLEFLLKLTHPFLSVAVECEDFPHI